MEAYKINELQLQKSEQVDRILKKIRLNLVNQKKDTNKILEEQNLQAEKLIKFAMMIIGMKFYKIQKNQKRLVSNKKLYFSAMKKDKLTYKQIAKMINKSEATIKYMKKTNPELLEIIKLGCIEKLKIARKNN